MSDKIVVPGLTPVESVNNGNDYDVKVWNRTYKISDAPLFSSIITNGKEALAGPIRLAGECFGKPIEWDKCENYEMEDHDDKQRTFVQSTQFRELILNTKMTVYYDGCVKCNITLAPQGYHRTAVYGQSPTQRENMRLNKFWLEIPFKKDFATLYHINPSAITSIDGKKVSETTFTSLDYVPKKSLVLPFKASVYLGNDDSGLATLFESDEWWRPEFKERCIEVLNQEDCVLLRVHFLDEEHLKWLDKGGFNGGYMYPINFEFGLITTPVKPFPANQFEDKGYHDGGFVKTKEGERITRLDAPMSKIVNEKSRSAQYYLKCAQNGKFSNDELFVDILKQCGVTTYYFHEMWNDLQNSVYLTTKTAERLRRVVELAHSRGIKLIPYFGYEISTLSPLFTGDFMKYKRMYEDTYYDFMTGGYYYRAPTQRDLWVCYKSEYKRILLDGIARLMDKFHFDGVYLDGTYGLPGCVNQLHGCGYKDENGVLHQTFDIWNKREMVEELYEIVHTRGGKVDVHTGNTFPIPFMPYADSVWDGEPIQSVLVQGTMDRIPEGHFRSLYTGRPIGVVLRPIIYTNPPVWTFHHSLSTMIAFGVLPKANTEDAMVEMKDVWAAYDSIPMEKAKFNPFFENDATSSNDDVRVSYFDYDDGILAIVANHYRMPSGKTEIAFNDKFKSAVDKITGEKIDLVNGNKFSVEFETFDYKIVELKKA